ncbi:ABC transporter permease [Ohtaekwangia koreensis]|uniref:Putative ABC transport system permease protein n=1 Tax=Ohtaekwangia koreensis TaxID=688867 RepID=A0A1T5MHN4_9BACT|nr:ABC transporter permease [Ohtaekwangia koreensis]SKC87444.1 putative ABC transport system permease protein [Ohtaekwangia koreensis]
MIRNYLLIALRNFKRQKLFAVLNMFGLALGLACAILIFLYISDELQYDTMHPYHEDTYRIGCTFTNASGQEFDNTVAPGYWLKQLKETRSEVTHGIRIDNIGYPTSFHHKASDKIILTEEVRWAEPGFDAVLAFDLLKGNKDKMFEDYNTLVISETGAKKLFNELDPIGQVVSIKHNWATDGKEIDVVVTGIYKDFPSNSHFKPQYIINVNALRSVRNNFTVYMEGTSFREAEFFESYIVVKHSSDIKPLEKDLQMWGNQMAQADSGFVAGGWKLKPFLAKMSGLHFDQKNLWENGIRGDKKYLAIFSSVAILILVIACINYMNLATARSARRAKEVGLRKSLGSRRSEIAWQFFSESILMTAGSLILAVLLVIIFLQPFNQLAHKSFTVASLLNPFMLLIVGVIVMFMAFVSGSYPALYLSGFRPVEVLKGKVIKGAGAELFRKGLVTIQYTVSLVLIISTFIVIRQMEHMQNTKLNAQGSQLLSIRYGGTAPQDKFAAFKQAILQDKDIEHVTMANHLPRLNYFGWIGTTLKFPELHDKDLQWNQLNIDFDFAKTYQLEFIAGRDFDAANVADSSSMIINEAAVKALQQPLEKIIGSSVMEVDDNNGNGNRTYKVIGVVKDFPFRSMHQPIEPLVLNPHVHFIDRIAYIKLPAGNFQEKIKSIEKKWKEIFPGVGFDYWFVSDEFNRMYLAESRVSSLAKSFAVLAIIITALGVFGLASYTAEQKTKEVGIRKVLGAAVRQVVTMFVWVFVKIFLVAAIIAIPIAYFLADRWLNDFAYRSMISPFIFLISLLGLLAVTLVTVSYETWKAARANPVNSLRSE